MKTPMHTELFYVHILVSLGLDQRWSPFEDLMPRNILGKFSALSPSVDLVRFPDISKCSWHMLALVGTSFGKFFMKLSGFQACTSVAACPKRMTREIP